MIEFKNVTVRLAGRTLIDDLNLNLNDNHRYGVVGRNGTGKSTLFNVLLGNMYPEIGSVEMPSRIRLGHIAQELPEGNKTPLEIVLAADSERLELLQKLETNADPEDMADIYDRLIAIDAFSAEARAAEILNGLGFDQEMIERPIATFSGGWQMRVALAALLFSEPDWLLLDEPTNHLDLEAAIWLTEFLRTYPKTLLIISHDRHLLNAVCDRILFLQGCKIQSYGGNFDTFRKTWEMQQENLRAQHTKQEAQKAHMMDFVNRFGAKATKAKQAQSRLKAIAKMEILPDVVNDPEIKFNLPQPTKLSPPLVTLEKVEVGYEPNKPILKGLGQRIDGGDRIALLGRNGNGKSTFAKLIAGRLKPQKGKMTSSSKLVVGYFAQNQVDEFDLNLNPIELLQQHYKHQTFLDSRKKLAEFGLNGTKAETKIGNLSGGEKARVNLCMICMEKPNILILDEPTNHLDMDSRQALMIAINEFPGAVIMITHDWDLLESTSDTLWLVDKGRVEPFDGDLADYRRIALKS